MRLELDAPIFFAYVSFQYSWMERGAIQLYGYGAVLMLNKAEAPIFISRVSVHILLLNHGMPRAIDKRKR